MGEKRKSVHKSDDSRLITQGENRIDDQSNHMGMIRVTWDKHDREEGVDADRFFCGGQ